MYSMKGQLFCIGILEKEKVQKDSCQTWCVTPPTFAERNQHRSISLIIKSNCLKALHNL